MDGYIAAPCSRAKLREIANLIRKAFGLRDVKFFPVVELLEFGLQSIYNDFNYEIIEVQKLQNKYAVTYPAKNLIKIREDVYYGAASGNGRDRFTIAHEIGHFILHKPENVALARSEIVEKIPKYKDPEWQANTFAGELLAPPHIIQGLTVHEIVRKCGVSRMVAEIQLKHAFGAKL